MKKRITAGIACAVALTTVCLAACSSQPVESNEGADEVAGAAAVSFEQLTSESEFSLLATHSQTLSGEVSTEMCLSCHEYGELAEDSADNLLDEGGKTVFNPHAGHVDFECVDCHNVTSDPVLQCDSCHYITAPDGWTTPDMGKAMYMDPDTIYGDLGYGTSGYSYSMDPDQEVNG